MNAPSPKLIGGLALPPAALEAGPTLEGLDALVEALVSAASPAEALAGVPALLAEIFGLRAGRVLLVDPLNGLAPLAGFDGEASPEAPATVMSRLLAGGAPAALYVGEVTARGKRKRGEKAWLLAAPVFVGGRLAGLLTARPSGAGGEQRKAGLHLLETIANLIGPPLAACRRARDKARAEAGEAKKIVGESAMLRQALAQAERFAPSDLPVLLRGESGTGKELFAQFVHDASRRAKKPFVKVNCAALPESVLESELFGHERGAFTGAIERRQGRFELADGGTLLLDEIGDITTAFQAKLLRVLQEGEFERVGGERTIKVDVRVIAATHRNLEAATARGLFRADLYYRLAVASIFLPALRERREDIPLLARHVLARFNAENDRELTLHPGAIELMCKCPYPGNVREMENCLRAAAAMAHEEMIVERDFPCRNRVCFSARLRIAQARAQTSHPTSQGRTALAQHGSPR